ncbi:transporter, partial [Xanthobacter sp. DSM 24535]|uniref:transporter n=1 Tax=Roseixanthobacter psychrophilus TaxID=3119917 RepID=UPI00372981A6
SFVVAPTVFDIITSVSPDEIGFYNTYFASQVSWAITDALRIGYRIGGYIPQDGPVAYNYGTIEQRAGLTYLANGLQMTANFMYGVTVGNGQQDRGPDYFVADLSATQTFGKWQLGPVMYATVDLTSPYAGYQKQSQVAVGGLVGYDFGGATLQLKLTTDVSESNYGGRETVVWSNLIIPLWTAKPAPAAPAVHK